MKKVMLAAAFTMVLAGCGGGGGEKIAYRPIAFGENNQCYYVNDPVEVQLLMERGLCERHWAPSVMPVYWHQMYYPYYSSPAYYRVYVPERARTTYVQSEKSWGSQNKTAIAEKAKGAQYQGSNGKVVAAEKIGATKYGAGNRFGPTNTKFGGGSRNATTPASGSPIKSTDPTVKANTQQTPATAKATPATSKPSPPKVEAPKPKPPSQPKSSSGGSKGFGGGSRGGRR